MPVQRISAGYERRLVQQYWPCQALALLSKPFLQYPVRNYMYSITCLWIVSSCDIAQLTPLTASSNSTVAVFNFVPSSAMVGFAHAAPPHWPKISREMC